MSYQAIKDLVGYALRTGLIDEYDRPWAVNELLQAMGMDAWEEPAETHERPLEDILKELLDDAAARGRIEDDTTNRDLFDTELMGRLTPRPSQVISEFRRRYQAGPKDATDWFYRFSQDTDYIRRYRIAKDVKWKATTPYGELDITINLSKPEKDPKAIAAARNGLEAAMCCSVGDDDFGRYLLGTLRENRVRCIRREPCREAVTTMAFVSLTEEGERSFTFVRKPGADMFLREEDVREADIRDTVIVHAGSCSLSASPAAEATAKALHLGREMGRLVSFDVNYRDMMWNGSQEACAAKVREILPDVDLLKISEEEADMLGGEAELPALMERYGLTLVVLTLGGQGARGYFRGRRLAVPGRRAHCADATGAGDAFWGGMLSQMRFRGVTQAEQLTEPLVQEALEYGNVSGWLCVQGRGAIPSLPTRQEIERHLV